MLSRGIKNCNIVIAGSCPSSSFDVSENLAASHVVIHNYYCWSRVIRAEIMLPSSIFVAFFDCNRHLEIGNAGNIDRALNCGV